MSMRDTLNELNELYEEKLQEDNEMGCELEKQKCIDEMYEILCENIIDDIEEYLYNVEFEHLNYSQQAADFVNKQMDRDPNSTPDEDILRPAIKRILRTVREALIYSNF